MDGLTVTGRRGGRPRQGGFTLLGVLFVLAGLGVGMAALGSMWQTAAQREKEKELLFVGGEYRRAIESFWNQSPGKAQRLPQTLGELLSDPRFPHTIRHLRRIYRDPMTGTSDWGLIREPGGGISGVYSLSEKKPFKTAGFPVDLEPFARAGSYRDWAFRFDPAKALENPATQAASASRREAARLAAPPLP